MNWKADCKPGLITQHHCGLKSIVAEWEKIPPAASKSSLKAWKQKSRNCYSCRLLPIAKRTLKDNIWVLHWISRVCFVSNKLFYIAKIICTYTFGYIMWFYLHFSGVFPRSFWSCKIYGTFESSYFMHAEARTTLLCILENISKVFCFTRSISVCDCFQSVVFVNILQSSTEVLIYNSYLSTERKTFSGEALCQNKAGLLTSFSPRRLSHSAGLK